MLPDGVLSIGAPALSPGGGHGMVAAAERSVVVTAVLTVTVAGPDALPFPPPQPATRAMMATAATAENVRRIAPTDSTGLRRGVPPGRHAAINGGRVMGEPTRDPFTRDAPSAK